MSNPTKVTMASVRQALFDLTSKGDKWVIVPEVATHMGYEGEVAYHGCATMVRGCLSALVQATPKIAQSRVRSTDDMVPGTSGRRPVEFQILPGGLSRKLPEDKERRNSKVDGTPRKPQPKKQRKVVTHRSTHVSAPEPSPPYSGRTVGIIRLPVKRKQSVESLKKLVTLAESIGDYAGISDTADSIELTFID